VRWRFSRRFPITSFYSGEQPSYFFTGARDCPAIWIFWLRRGHSPRQRIQAVVRSRIQPLAEIFGLGQLELRQDIANPDFIKHWVLANQKPLFSIDLTRIGGNVLETQIVKTTITDTPEITVLIPNADYLLFQKCETFFGRRNVKARDAFDIHLLLSGGAQINKTLRPHLEDFIAMNELDKESIKVRMEALTAKLCTVELRPVLPLALFAQLEKEGFEPIRQSLRTVFSDWLA
jgi:hypothetical protein